MIVNSQYQEVKYVSLKDLAALPPQQTQKYQTEWNTYTSKFGFPSQGIFNDSNYAQYLSVDGSATRDVLAVSQNSGLVKLYRYPCTEKNSASKEFRGHGSKVSRLRFSAQDKYLVSIGGYDQSVLVWEV